MGKQRNSDMGDQYGGRAESVVSWCMCVFQYRHQLLSMCTKMLRSSNTFVFHMVMSLLEDCKRRAVLVGVRESEGPLMSLQVQELGGGGGGVLIPLCLSMSVLNCVDNAP